MLEIAEDDQIQSIRSDSQRTHKKINLSRHTSTQVIFSSGVTILMRCCGSIALHQMKLRTRHLDKMKAYDHMQLLRARGLIPTDGSRARHDQRGRDHTFVRERALANIILTGITLRQYRTLLYELLLFESKLYRSLLYELCMDGPGRYLSTLCVSTRFCANI